MTIVLSNKREMSSSVSQSAARRAFDKDVARFSVSFSFLHGLSASSRNAHGDLCYLLILLHLPAVFNIRAAGLAAWLRVRR